MEKLKNSLGLILMAFLCAYTVNGISQAKEPVKKVVVVKKTIDNGVETVERKEYSGEDLSDEDFKKMIEADDAEIDVNVWKKDDGNEIEITVDKREGNGAFIDAETEKLLKEKGISIDDIATMNINLDSSIENGKEVFEKVITIVDKEGKTQEFVMNGDMAEMNGSMSIDLKNHQKPKLGVLVDQHESGILIEEIVVDSPAEKAGLKKGDIITAIADTPVVSIDDLLAALKGAGEETVVSFRRDTEALAVKVELKEFEHDAAEKKKVIKKYRMKNN